MMPAIKNFLRMQKGQGFKEPLAVSLFIDNTFSEYFLQETRANLVTGIDQKVSKDFLNSVFNNLNEVTTELFVTFKELKNNYNFNLLRRTKHFFQVIVDFYRLLEILTQWAPEIFVAKNQINSYRLINYIMFVLDTVFNGGLST